MESCLWLGRFFFQTHLRARPSGGQEVQKERQMKRILMYEVMLKSRGTMAAVLLICRASPRSGFDRWQMEIAERHIELGKQSWTLWLSHKEVEPQPVTSGDGDWLSGHPTWGWVSFIQVCRPSVCKRALVSGNSRQPEASNGARSAWLDQTI